MMGPSISLVSGRGGVSDPSQVAGLDVYLKDGTTYSAATGVWTDSSGNGHNFTAPGTKPTASTINGVASARFDGTDRRLSGTHGLTVAAEAFFVLKNIGTDHGFHRMHDAAAGAAYYPLAGTIYESFGSTTRRDAIGLPVTLTSAHVYNVRSAAGLYEVAFDGAAPFYTSGTNTFGSIAAFLLGMNQDGAFYNGDIGSVIVYSRVLSAGERAAVCAFLRAKWGTP